MDQNISNENRKIRVWCDGCFDVVHYGHANSMRQAKLMGDVLVVGVHDDESVARNKGIPVFSQEQRYKMVRGIKWVDEVVEGSTYFPTADTLIQYNCDFATHGDDLSITLDGQDPYQTFKDEGLLRIFKRTEGVSTTDIVRRMLLCTKFHDETNGIDVEMENFENFKTNGPDGDATRVSKFLLTSCKIIQFSDGKEAKLNEKVVYVSGDWDLFHPGHLDFLEAASKEGDYLIVGIHSDLIINRKKGLGYPIMNMHERTLSILACKYVSEVVIGAPYTITAEMMKQLNVDLVCHGWTSLVPDRFECDPFNVPKKFDKFKLIDTSNRLTTTGIIKAFAERRLDYERRNANKEEREKI